MMKLKKKSILTKETLEKNSSKPELALLSRNQGYAIEINPHEGKFN